jgi:hypothetical protein
MAYCAGESDADHRELVNFCRDFKFQRMGCFTYSEEDGTPAAEYPSQVSASLADPGVLGLLCRASVCWIWLVSGTCYSLKVICGAAVMV